MRGYTVHLLFHLLAAALGAATGVAAALWWAGHNRAGLWLAIAALVLGAVILVVQGLYISNQPAPTRQSRRASTRARTPPGGNGRSANGTRPELEPVPAPESRDEPSTRRY